MTISGLSIKLRIAVVISATWMSIIFFYALDKARIPFGGGLDVAIFLKIVIALGVLPLLLIWGVIWIRAASR